MPAVSVIIPTYNRAKLLEEAIASVRQQTYRDVEIVVVDDGSTDDTRTCVEALDHSVRYIYQPNRGRSAARNVGIGEAYGRFVLFLDSDDLLLPASLEYLVGYLDAHPDVAVVYSAYDYCDLAGRPVGCPQRLAVAINDRTTFLGHVFLDNAEIAPCSAMVRREWLDRIGPFYFDETLSVGEDTDLWVRLAAQGAEFEFLKVRTCLYRVHPGNTAGPGSAEQRPSVLSNPQYRESYHRSRLKLFHSDLFPTLSPPTQSTFLYMLLLDSAYSDYGAREIVLNSRRFAELPRSVQSRILYQVGVDELIHGRDDQLARTYLARASRLCPVKIMYHSAYLLSALSVPAFRAFVSTMRRTRDLKGVVTRARSLPV